MIPMALPKGTALLSDINSLAKMGHFSSYVIIMLFTPGVPPFSSIRVASNGDDTQRPPSTKVASKSSALQTHTSNLFSLLSALRCFALAK